MCNDGHIDLCMRNELDGISVHNAWTPTKMKVTPVSTAKKEASAVMFKLLTLTRSIIVSRSELDM